MKIALVLSGGGARGAYEMGVLSELLPELERRGEAPAIIVGTSVGAFNAAFLASNAHRPARDAVADGVAFWHETGWRDSLAPIGALPGEPARRRLFAQLLGVKRPRVHAVLDPTPLESTLARVADFDQIARNVGAGGPLDAVAVATTSALTGHTVVFHAGGDPPERDPVRQIDYVRASLSAAHVRASGAIPALFPAVHVDAPARARGWYYDGGVRLNTPIKPALELGADRVVVIGLNSLAAAPDRLAGPHQPDVFEGSALVMQALVSDRLTEDMRELAAENVSGGNGGGRLIPYVFVAPRKPDELGAIAARVWREHYAGARGLLRDRDLALLGRFVAGGDDPTHGELLSLLFFAPEFADELVALGRSHAREWLATPHEDGPWRTGPLPG
jgi:NTE family protein